MSDTVDPIRERTFFMLPEERWQWDHADSENARRRIEGASRRRIYDEQQAAAARAQEDARIAAEIAAARVIAEAELPTLAEAAELVRTNANAIPNVKARVDAAFYELRKLQNCPVGRVDRYRSQLDVNLRVAPSAAHVLRLWFSAERWAAELSTQRAEFTSMSHVDLMTSVALRAPLAPSFDPVNFLGRLAARGITLAINPSGKLVATLPGLLNQQDRVVINEQRQAILAALGSAEEI